MVVAYVAQKTPITATTATAIHGTSVDARFNVSMQHWRVDQVAAMSMSTSGEIFHLTRVILAMCEAVADRSWQGV